MWFNPKASPKSISVNAMFVFMVNKNEAASNDRRRRRRRRKMAHRRYCGRQPPSPQASPSSSDAVIAALREGFERASN